VNHALALYESVADAVKMHVDCFGFALLNCFVVDSGGACIVDLDGYGALGMPHFNEAGAKGIDIVVIMKEGGEFCFGG
jgi:hypothetical protein